MDTLRSAPKFTKPKKILFFVIIYLFLALLLVVGAELILRLKGHQTWRPEEVRIQVSPGGTFFIKHPTLGYSHIPGTFTVTLSTGYSFSVNHLPSTLRITHPLGSYDGLRKKEEIWIFGCSLTHGWSLNDEETYPWLLQERFPAYEVVNFGVSGYGTIHSLIQFRHELEVRRPKVAVLAYAGFHDERNTFLRSRARLIAPWSPLGPLTQPYASINEEGTLRYSMAEGEYTEFPFVRFSALAHFIELMYDRLEYKFSRSHTVSETLVKEMASLAKIHGIKFVVAGISQEDDTVAMLHFAQENGIPSVGISVNNDLKEYNNLPHDDHPSALANKKYADKLVAFLKAEILK